MSNYRANENFLKKGGGDGAEPEGGYIYNNLVSIYIVFVRDILIYLNILKRLNQTRIINNIKNLSSISLRESTQILTRNHAKAYAKALISLRESTQDLRESTHNLRKDTQTLREITHFLRKDTQNLCESTHPDFLIFFEKIRKYFFWNLVPEVRNEKLNQPGISIPRFDFPGN